MPSSGHWRSRHRCAGHWPLVDKYSLPEFPERPEHALVLININKLEDRFDRKAIYNLVRYCWRISKDRAEKAEYVLAVVRGVVVGAFKPTRWMNATPENFPDIPHADGSESHRVGFVGEEAPAEIWELYAGQRGKRVVSADLKHVQNPIRFWQV